MNELLDWSAEDATAWAQGQDDVPHRAQHKLRATGLFEDDALERLLDEVPRDTVHPYTMGTDPAATHEWRRGAISQLPAADLLDAVRSGRLWLNVVGVGKHSPAMADLVSRLYGEITTRVPGFHPDDVKATLLISSPSAQVYYHADNQPNALWHIRGAKRAYVYPAGDPFISTENLERLVAGESDEQLPYRREFDDSATVLELAEGQVGWWPQNRPHRVENVEGLNVSLSTEHRTHGSTRREHVWTANHYGRNVLRGRSLDTSEAGLAASGKVAALRVGRKLLRIQHAGAGPAASFEIDPSAPLCVRSTGS